jgi:hypothetical protein
MKSQYNVNNQHAKIVFDNAVSVVNTFLPQTKSAYKKPLIASLFRGMSTKDVHNATGINSHTCNAALASTYHFLDSDLFKLKEKHGVVRQKIKDTEIEITVEEMKKILVGRSGSRAGTFYTADTQMQMWRKYLGTFAHVVQKLTLRGAKYIPKRPRSLKHFFLRIMARIRLVRVHHPKNCPHCDDFKRAEADQRRVLARKKMSVDPEEIEAYDEELAVIKKRLIKGHRHKTRREVQRRWVTNYRENMKDGECLLWMDYGSWYSNRGLK